MFNSLSHQSGHQSERFQDVMRIAGLPENVQLVGDEIPPLAPGYHYSVRLLRFEPDVPKLIEDHFPPSDLWRPDTPQDWIRRSRDYMRGRKLLIDVGVEDAADRLVGFGRISPDQDWGYFQSLVVDTDHRRRGIGTAIILARFRLAEKAGYTSMYMEKPEASNDRLAMYRSLGFQEGPQGELYFKKDGWGLVSHWS